MRSQETQSLEMRWLRCYWGRLQDSQIKEDTFTPESTTVVIKHRRLIWLGHVCCMPTYMTLLVKYSLKRRGDQIINVARLLLLTIGRCAVNRAGCTPEECNLSVDN